MIKLAGLKYDDADSYDWDRLENRSRFARFLDEFVDADCQRYQYILPEADAIPFSITVVLCCLCTVVFIGNLIIHDDNGIRGVSFIIFWLIYKFYF